MSKPIYVLNGPNLNLLGTREPEIYGAETLDGIRARCESRAMGLGFDVVFKQSNHEGDLVGFIQEAGQQACAVVLNPAAYGHTSIAILDALKTLSIPVVECHLSNPARREAFRHTSYVSLAATGIVSGFGPASYDLAIEAAAGLVTRPA